MTINLKQYEAGALEGGRSNFVPEPGKHLLKFTNYVQDDEKGYEAYDVAIESEKDKGQEFRIFVRLNSGSDKQKEFWGKQLVRACRVNGLDLETFSPENLVNGHVWADIKVGEYNGKPQVSPYFCHDNLPGGLSLEEQDPFENLA